MIVSDRPKVDVVELFNRRDYVNVCAPMVRYSKLEFRSLVRKYGANICFTPMIIADSFVQSEKARQNEFTTAPGDEPLIVQFAANNADDFVNAAELIYPFADGVDLNCGCPQRWAMKEGYGADLMLRPQTIKTMLSQVRNRLPGPFSVSIKTRIFDDVRRTVELCRGIESAGASFLTIHGRTVDQRGEPVNYDGVRTVSDSLSIPVIVNGGVKSPDDLQRVRLATGCCGVMVAQGLLNNPALFSGADTTPISCVKDWVNLSTSTSFQCFHHHLVFMLEKVLPRELRLVFNKLNSTDAVLRFLSEHLNVIPTAGGISKSTLTYAESPGKYFKEKIIECEEVSLTDSWFCA